MNNLIANRRIRSVSGWIFVRPRRWIFWKMICTSYGPRWVPRKHDFFGWQWPDFHWWILYKTVFSFFRWLHYDAWRPFCTWDRVLIKKPLIAKIIHRIGSTTAGFAIGGGECYHCASPAGCQVELAGDDTGENFRLIKTWTSYTPDGTDYCFMGITTCPACGYEAEYEDGSL